MFEIAVIGHQKVEVEGSFFDFIERKVSNIQREDLGYRLYKKAILFLLFHELAHLARGHGGTLQAHGGSSMIMESHPSDAKQDGDSKLRQWLELEADWLATIWTMQNQPLKADIKEAKDSLLESLFAINIVFLLFYLADQRAESNSHSHPHPLVRLYGITNNLPDYLVSSDRYPFSSTDEVAETLEGALTEAGIVSELAGIDWVQYTDKNIDLAQTEIKVLKEHIGEKWIARGNRSMKRRVKSPPYL